MSTAVGTADDDLTYEAAMSEVEDITRRLQDGAISVDDMFAAATRGRQLLARNEAKLRDVEHALHTAVAATEPQTGSA